MTHHVTLILALMTRCLCSHQALHILTLTFTPSYSTFYEAVLMHLHISHFHMEKVRGLLLVD